MNIRLLRDIIVTTVLITLQGITNLKVYTHIILHPKTNAKTW